MVAGPQGVAADGVLSDPTKASGVADAAAVLEVLKDGAGLGVGATSGNPAEAGTPAPGTPLTAGMGGMEMPGMVMETPTIAPIVFVA